MQLKKKKNKKKKKEKQLKRGQPAAGPGPWAQGPGPSGPAGQGSPRSTRTIDFGSIASCERSLSRVMPAARTPNFVMRFTTCSCVLRGEEDCKPFLCSWRTHILAGELGIEVTCMTRDPPGKDWTGPNIWLFFILFGSRSYVSLIDFASQWRKLAKNLP